MSVALVFTLSRGAIVSLLLTMLILLLILRALGRIRWSLMVLGALLIAVLGYGTWIGLEPLLIRVRQADYAARFIQGLTTLPMLRTFPLLGVGLGAYGDMYPRYQPLALAPGKVSYPYAHDDLLQLAVELGAIGAGAHRVDGAGGSAGSLGATSSGGRPARRRRRARGAQRRDRSASASGRGVGSVLVISATEPSISQRGFLPTASWPHVPPASPRWPSTRGSSRPASGSWTEIPCGSLAGRSGLALAVGSVAIVVSLAAVPWIVRPALVAGPAPGAERPGRTASPPFRWSGGAGTGPRNERALALRGG